MCYSIIDRKVESHTFGVWPVKENIKTTLTLVKMDNGSLGLIYEADFSGVKSGHVSGGPREINGDGTIVVNPNPKVVVSISQYKRTDTYGSMHIKITVDIPVIGSETIFDKTLGGNLPAGNAWENAVNELQEKIVRDKAEAL